MEVIEALKQVLLTDFTAAPGRMEGESDICFKEEPMSFAEELTNQEFEDTNAVDTLETCTIEMKAEAFEFDNIPNQRESVSMELQRVSMEQMVAMFDYFDKQPHLARGVSTGVGSQHEVDRLWAVIGKRLNHMGKARKNTHQWKKYWSTLKCRIKKKAATLRAGASGALSVMERRVLALLGEDMAVYQTVSESKPETENPTSRSPSPRVDDDDFSWPSEEEVFIKAGSPPPTPKRARPSSVRGRPARSRNTSQMSCGSSFEPWLVNLERRRVAAEEKMADAMKTMADAALLNAQTLRLCAQAGIHLRASNGRAREPSAE